MILFKTIDGWQVYSLNLQVQSENQRWDFQLNLILEANFFLALFYPILLSGNRICLVKCLDLFFISSFM